MIQASSTFTPGPDLVPSLLAAVGAGVSAAATIVADEARAIVHVRSGDLRDSIEVQPPEVSGNMVSADVTAGTDHNFYVEYGTGRRGEASPGAGDGPYDQNWAGMEALPYMRPPLDTRRDDIFNAMATAVSDAL
jgi:hypothetical protein